MMQNAPGNEGEVSSVPGPVPSVGLLETTYLTARSRALRDILDRFQLREALECRAVYRAARAQRRDLRAARGIAAAMQDVIAHPDRATWNRLEIDFHRALHDQGGNRLLADMTEQTHREVQCLYVRWQPEPVYDAETMRRLQAQHLALLEAIELGDAETAIAHARAHVRSVRETVAAVMQDPDCGPLNVWVDDPW
jgi:DNA-binding GntR family transcriptional regulator